MNVGNVVKWSFVISLVFELVGAFMKILHLPGADQLLIVGMVANGVFIVAALFEIWDLSELKRMKNSCGLSPLFLWVF